MHIHGNSMSVNAASLYSASQQERTAAAQRAAGVRKKLIRGASEIDGAASPEETLMIGKWVSEEQYPNSVSGKDPDLG